MHEARLEPDSLRSSRWRTGTRDEADASLAVPIPRGWGAVRSRQIQGPQCRAARPEGLTMRTVLLGRAHRHCPARRSAVMISPCARRRPERFRRFARFW